MNTSSPIVVADHIRRLVPYQPGKPIDEVKRELGLTNVIKLASNENPLGPSPKAVSAVHESIGGVNVYPDGACYGLRRALAPRHGVGGDWLAFGNGSDELIHYLGLALLEPGDEVVVGDPSFVRYESAAALNRARCMKVPLRDWTHDLDAMLHCVSDRTRLVFVANPNNPTGTIVRTPEVRAMLAALPPRVVAVFDEAYHEYVDHPDYPDTIKLALEGSNVVSLRTFSKAYGLAGLRVGYAVARPDIVSAIEQVREPFNVSLVAQVAAAAALDDTEHLTRTRETNAAGMVQLQRAFDELGLPYAPSSANFLWVDVRRPCRQVFERLLRSGVIVRTGDVFGFPTHLRITIGTQTENASCVDALKEALSA